MARKIPSLLGLALTLLRTAHGWTAKELAARSGVARSTLSSYESGDLVLTRERLEELAGHLELGPDDVERAVLAAELVHPAAPPPRTPVDPTDEERRVIEKAAALAGRDTRERVRDDLLRELRADKARRALEEGEELFRRLKPYSDAARRDLIEGAPDYQHWGLAVHLCHRSKNKAADNPGEALMLAELALHVARHVDGAGTWRSRLQGHCTAFVANAQRVGNDFPKAEATFTHAWRLWRDGEDEAGLLSEAHLLDLEASLRGDQRLFPQALKLHDGARRLARPNEVGSILLNKACTLQEKGDHEEALRTLDEAVRFIDCERDLRLRCVLRFNQAANLLRLSRAQEAAAIVAEVRELAERLRNDNDLVRTLWLEGNLDAGLGRREEALAKLEQVRRAFERRRLPFDYALASLDVALLHREDGLFTEIQILAGEMLSIFEELEVHREAIAAVLLLLEAAEKRAVTTELVRRLQDYLTKSQKNPQLRFEA